MLRIVSAPNPVLSTVAKPVEKIDKQIFDLIKAMKKTLDGTKDPEGVGLAAPQVGKSLQLFIAKPSPTSNVMVCINPTIEKLNEEKKDPQKKSSFTKLEGCLSLPNIWGEVKRPSSVLLAYLDENGKSHKKRFTGFLATIVQHECDHLQGILFPRHVLLQKGKLFKSRKNSKNEDVFEELEI